MYSKRQDSLNNEMCIFSTHVFMVAPNNLSWISLFIILKISLPLNYYESLDTWYKESKIHGKLCLS